MTKNRCRPINGHCARYPAIRIHDEGVCRRCRHTGGRSMDLAAHPPPAMPPRSLDCAYRGKQTAWRDCATCGGRTRLRVYACILSGEGVTLIDCRECDQRGETEDNEPRTGETP